MWFPPRAWSDDRVDSGPRDRRLAIRADRIWRLLCRHASCTGKTVREHSPTRRKEREMMRINRGVTSPINCLYPSITEPTRGAPHGRPRGRVAFLPLGAPCAPPARATRALPRGLSAASQPELVPCATSPWPLSHVNRRVTLQVKPLFAIFLIRNSIYKSNKNQKKCIKLQKFIFLKIQLLLISNFLHWITNFFLFNIMPFKIYLERRIQDDL